MSCIFAILPSSLQSLCFWHLVCIDKIRKEQDFYLVCSGRSLELAPLPWLVKFLFLSLSFQVWFSSRRSFAQCNGSICF